MKTITYNPETHKLVPVEPCDCPDSVVHVACIDVGGCKLKAARSAPQHEERTEYPLPDDLYPGSKDWLAADYAGRVEWLHMMYEAVKRYAAKLGARLPDKGEEPSCEARLKENHD